MDFTNQPAQSILSAIHYEEWSLNGWAIAFLFSERVLTEIRKLSREENWYEDPVIASTYIDRLNLSFLGIQKFHATFGMLPQVGDYLFDEEMGLVVQGRSIDGGLMRITYVVGL